MKDTYRSVNGLTTLVPKNESLSQPPCRICFDKIDLTIMRADYLPTQPVFDEICENLNGLLTTPYKETDYQWRGLYQKSKWLESETERIQVFYDRSRFKPEIKVLGKITFTVIDKKVGYGNHVASAIQIENLFKENYIPHHLGSLEIALDCSTQQQDEHIFKCCMLNYLRETDNFYFNGEKDPKTGKPIPITGFDPDGANKYQKGRESSGYLKCYKRDDRLRLELSLNRSFLHGRKLDHVSQLLLVGPTLLFEKVNLVEFIEKEIRDYSPRRGKKPRVSDIKNIFTESKSSAEILFRLSAIFQKPAGSIKSKFGHKREFPPFFIDL